MKINIELELDEVVTIPLLAQAIVDYIFQTETNPGMDNDERIEQTCISMEELSAILNAHRKAYLSHIQTSKYYEGGSLCIDSAM